jgi:hypothetical protein
MSGGGWRAATEAGGGDVRTSAIERAEGRPEALAPVPVLACSPVVPHPPWPGPPAGSDGRSPRPGWGVWVRVGSVTPAFSGCQPDPDSADALKDPRDRGQVSAHGVASGACSDIMISSRASVRHPRGPGMGTKSGAVRSRTEHPSPWFRGAGKRRGNHHMSRSLPGKVLCHFSLARESGRVGGVMSGGKRGLPQGGTGWPREGTSTHQEATSDNPQKSDIVSRTISTPTTDNPPKTTIEGLTRPGLLCAAVAVVVKERWVIPHRFGPALPSLRVCCWVSDAPWGRRTRGPELTPHHLPRQFSEPRHSQSAGRGGPLLQHAWPSPAAGGVR